MEFLFPFQSPGSTKSFTLTCFSVFWRWIIFTQIGLLKEFRLPQFNLSLPESCLLLNCFLWRLAHDIQMKYKRPTIATIEKFIACPCIKTLQLVLSNMGMCLISLVGRYQTQPFLTCCTSKLYTHFVNYIKQTKIDSYWYPSAVTIKISKQTTPFIDRPAV